MRFGSDSETILQATAAAPGSRPGPFRFTAPERDAFCPHAARQVEAAAEQIRGNAAPCPAVAAHQDLPGGGRRQEFRLTDLVHPAREAISRPC